MGYNKKQIRVDNARKPAKPKDVIYDSEGQWKYPGQVTKIPSGNITMQDIPYPVLGVDNLGNQQMMYPDMNYIFPGDSVTEYPQMMYGGDPSIPDLESMKRGGIYSNMYALRKQPHGYTSSNIMTSVNEIMKRNETLYGPWGTKFYRPANYNNMRKKKLGGTPEAFPQQPTYNEFLNYGAYPSGPVGFYKEGGMPTNIHMPEAFPQQPTYGYMFNGDTWNPQFMFGGGLPGGANEMPCFECGGIHKQYGGSPDQDHYMMNQGGYHMMPDGTMMADEDMEYKKGGWIQKATKNMRKDKPCTGSKFGGPSCPPGSKRYNLAKTFRAMAKKEYGGDTNDINDLNEDDYAKKITNTFLGTLKDNMLMNLADEAAEKAAGYDLDMMGEYPIAQMGMTMQDYGYNPNMNFNDMYAAKAQYLKNQGRQAMGNFFDSSMNLQATQNPYMDYSVIPKAADGYSFSDANTNQVPTNKSYSDASGKTHWSDEDYMNEYRRRNGIPMPNNQSYYNPGYNTQGYPGIPMNYNPGYKWRTQGLDMPIPYNPNNTYLTHLEAKKRLFGPGARKVKMDFRTYGQPGSSTGRKSQSLFDRPGYNPTEDYKAPKRRMSYDAEVEDLRQQYELGKTKALPVATRPNYPFAPKDTSGVPYLNPQRAAGPDTYPFAPQMQQGGYSMAPDPGQYMNDMDNNYQDWSIVGKYRPGYDPEAAANWLLAGTAGVTSMLNARDRRNTEERMQRNTLADNQFYSVGAGDKGKWNWTGMSTGMIDPYNTGKVVQQPGYVGAYGGQYQEGGEYEMTEAEIEEFLRNGGSIEYL